MMLIYEGKNKRTRRQRDTSKQSRIFEGGYMTYLVDVLGTVVQAPPNSAGASRETKRITNL